MNVLRSFAWHYSTSIRKIGLVWLEWCFHFTSFFLQNSMFLFVGKQNALLQRRAFLHFLQTHAQSSQESSDNTTCKPQQHALKLRTLPAQTRKLATVAPRRKSTTKKEPKAKKKKETAIPNKNVAQKRKAKADRHAEEPDNKKT